METVCTDTDLRDPRNSKKNPSDPATGRNAAMSRTIFGRQSAFHLAENLCESLLQEEPFAKEPLQGCELLV